MLTFIGNYLGSHGNLDDEIPAACSSEVLASAWRAAARLEMLGIAEIDKGIQPFDRFKDDIAALAAVTAVGAAIFNIFFAPETHRARATCARADEYLGLIQEMHGRSEEHTSELQSLMRISYAVFCLQKKNTNTQYNKKTQT